MFSRRALIPIVIGLSTLVGLPVTQAAPIPVTLGTGDVEGVYFPVGRAICERYRQQSGMTCEAVPTGGSLYNARGIATGDFDFGLVQSDIQFQALRGRAAFFDYGPNTALRSVLSLHAEAFTVVARAPEIQTFDDLIGRRVNVGNPGSGHRATLNALLKERWETEQDFVVASELKPEDMTRTLCAGRLDAFFYVVGHPSKAIDQATRHCNAHLVNITGAAVDTLVQKEPYYSKATIPGGLYANTPDDIDTFGVRATLMTRVDISNDTVYSLVKAIFEDFDAFRAAHPSLAGLTPQRMIRAGLTAPLHPGARRYFEERGWLSAPEAGSQTSNGRGGKSGTR